MRLRWEDHYENRWRTNVVGTKHILRLQQSHLYCDRVIR